MLSIHYITRISFGTFSFLDCTCPDVEYDFIWSYAFGRKFSIKTITWKQWNNLKIARQICQDVVETQQNA